MQTIKEGSRKQHYLYVNNYICELRMLRLVLGTIVRKRRQMYPLPLKKKNGSGTELEFEKAEEFNGQFINVFT